MHEDSLKQVSALQVTMRKNDMYWILFALVNEKETHHYGMISRHVGKHQVPICSDCEIKIPQIKSGIHG